MAIVSRFLEAVRGGLQHLARALGPGSDSWERFDIAPPAGAFGPGARQDFAWYLTGQSAVGVSSGEDVRDWLLGCAYVHDPGHAAGADAWQHPCEFERSRRGDCEDFALWAWRKLLELGLDAKFVVGHCANRTGGERHAWVLVRIGETDFLVEATACSPELMIRPLADVRGNYRPECGVGRDLKPYVFAGFIDAVEAVEQGRGA